jgi:hypothetical protein
MFESPMENVSKKFKLIGSIEKLIFSKRNVNQFIIISNM